MSTPIIPCYMIMVDKHKNVEDPMLGLRDKKNLFLSVRFLFYHPLLPTRNIQSVVIKLIFSDGPSWINFNE